MNAATTSTRDGESLFNLIAGLREDVRNLFQEEVKLAKTEISEKMSYFSRNTVYLAIGGVIAVLGLGMLLMALSFLLAVAFEAMGLSYGIALFVGFLAIAIVTAAIGGAIVGKAISTLKKESLMPEKTIQSLKEIKDGGLEQATVKRYHSTPAVEDNRNSEEIRSNVEATRSRISHEVRGIKTRLRMATMAVTLADRLRHHPVRSVGIGVGTGVAGFLLMRVARIFGRRRHAISH